MKQMRTDKILRGSYGKVWVGNDLFSAVKQFEAKAKFDFEEVNIAGDLGEHRRLVGYKCEGTMTMHKIDSTMQRKIGEDYKNGIVPDIRIIAVLDDPTAYGAERVELTEVTFDELTLMQFANKEVVEEEVPFKCAGYNFIDLI